MDEALPRSTSRIDGSRAVNCRHCGSEEVEKVVRHRRGAMYRCTRCMGYSNAPAEDTDPGYDRAYFERNYAPLVARQSEEARHCLRRIRDVAPSGSILDYGCGTGVLLRVAAEEFGYRANMGVDVSGAALSIASESTDGDVDWVHLPHQAVPERKFEVVCFMNSLAGLKDARQIVDTIRDRHLAPGGALVIRTPNIPSRYLRRVTRWAPILGPSLTAALVF